MSYLSFIIALIQMVNDNAFIGKSFYEGLDLFLDRVVGVEQFFVNVSLIVAAVLFIIALIAFFITRRDGELFGCGCMLLILAVIWPVLELVTLWIASHLAGSVTAAGIVDPTTFWLMLILMVLLGSG